MADLSLSGVAESEQSSSERLVSHESAGLVMITGFGSVFLGDGGISSVFISTYSYISIFSTVLSGSTLTQCVCVCVCTCVSCMQNLIKQALVQWVD